MGKTKGVKSAHGGVNMFQYDALQDVAGSSDDRESADLRNDKRYNYFRVLEDGVDGSSTVGLSRSIEKDEKLIKGIQRAKLQVIEGDLSTYDEVF